MQIQYFRDHMRDRLRSLDAIAGQLKMHYAAIARTARAYNQALGLQSIEHAGHGASVDIHGACQLRRGITLALG